MRARTRAPLEAHAGLPHARRVADGLPVAGVPAMATSRNSIYVREAAHAGLVRLPDVPASQRIALMAEVIDRYRQALETRAVVTVRDDRIRVSRPPET